MLKKWGWVVVFVVVIAAGVLFFLSQKPAPEKNLPVGYTLQSYTVEKVTEVSCTRDTDCETPPEYLIRSSCPFTSICMKGACAVVCPTYKEQ